MTDYSSWTDEQVNEAIAELRGVDITSYPEHDWERNEDGSIDIFGMESEFHNGPLCIRCGYSYCHHCTPPEKGDLAQLPCRADIPDYTHSWELCGELLEEMQPADVDLMYFMSLNKWGVDWVDNDDVEHEVVADTPTRAICEAWLAWREQG